MNEQKSLLRSAYAIAKRKGENTNWEAFEKRLFNELERQKREKMEKAEKDFMIYKDELHPSHVTRGSDASTYDVVCINCGHTDTVPGSWGELAKPCVYVSHRRKT